jgi:hypothetical protein
VIDATRWRAAPPKPWIDEVPEPLEAADAEQATALWRVRTPIAGQLMARKVVLTAPRQAADLVRQLRQLQQLTLYNVESVVGASEQPDAVWALLEPVPSCTVGRLLSSAEVTVPQRAILALDLLAGLAELHAAGLSHARLTERTVIVDAEGRLRLAEPWQLPGEATEPASEVKRASELACWILGVGSRPGGDLAPAEHQAPALVAVARALAAGAESKASDAFQALREAAGRLAQRDNLEPSRAELSRLVRGILGLPSVSVPPPQPQVSVRVGAVYAPAAPTGAAPVQLADLDEEVAPPPPRPRPSPVRGWRPSSDDWQRMRPRVPVVAVGAAAVAGVLLLLLVVVPALLSLSHRTTPGAPASQSQARPASPTATPAPATPTPQQSLAGAVTGIQVAPQGNCQPGARCSLRVQVNMQPPPSQTEVTWTLKVTDLCHGNTTTSEPGSSVTAQAGWTYVYSISSASLPNSGKVQVVAETSSPANATSDPLTIGSGC